LDNVVFKLGFTPTRTAARQLVAHKHIKVNDRVVNAGSYHVKVGDVISLVNDKTLKIPMVEQSLARKDYVVPAWLEKQGTAGKLVAPPDIETLEKQINLRLVIEFYSR
jgi:small subunit ribosomal protein S4